MRWLEPFRLQARRRRAQKGSIVVDSACPPHSNTRGGGVGDIALSERTEGVELLARATCPSFTGWTHGELRVTGFAPAHDRVRQA